MAIFPHHSINTASCAPHHHHQHRIIPSAASPERLQRERLVALEFFSAFQKTAHEQNMNLFDLSMDEMRFLGGAIYQHSGLLQGFVAGSLTLVTLRRGPTNLVRYLQMRHHLHHPGGGPKLSNVNSSPFQPSKNITFHPPNESPLMKAGWWLIDLTLSFAGACMVATATTNQQELLMTLVQIPRVLPESSSSKIADSFCPPAMLILQDLKNSRKQRKYHDDTTTAAATLIEDLSPPQSVMLQAMMDFTLACQQRENRKEFFAQHNRDQQEQGIMMNYDNDDVVVNDDDDDSALSGTTTYNDISTTNNWDDSRG